VSYHEFHQRCLRQPGALAAMGVQPGDRVAVLAANGSLLLEAHYGIPYAGAVLVALNTRLSAPELARIVSHCGARVLLQDAELGDEAATVRENVHSPLTLVKQGAHEAWPEAVQPGRLDITHLYGLTETFGPLAICDWRSEWNRLPADEQARLRARQGVANFNDPEATAAAIPDGWFRTGDLAVVHPGGYLEIRDRKKDVIISGGSTGRVENEPGPLASVVLGGQEEGRA
jgi:acyl-CoA synthetase (AMP-forming)/AMP-acid ligase II